MTDDQDQDQDLRRRAERRADAKIGFQIHALVYVLVNLGLLALNYLTSPTHWWVQWPAFGWGVGLLAHGISIYAHLGPNRERMIQAEMDRLRRDATFR